MRTQKVLLVHISIHSGFDMPFFSDKEPVSETLFNDRSLPDLIEMQNGRAENIVAEYGSDGLLATPTEDIVELAYEIFLANHDRGSPRTAKSKRSFLSSSSNSGLRNFSDE
jgi:hypothetical protein